MQPEAVCAQFALPGPPTGMDPVTGGHIHATYQVTCGEEAFILQRINTRVFRDPARVMENIARVCAHMQARVRMRGGDPLREALTLIPTRADHPAWIAPDGEWWRVYRAIPGARAVESGDAALLEQAAFAFGDFQTLLADLPAPRLHETLPGFHDTPARVEALRRAAQQDSCGRGASAAAELAFAWWRTATAATVVDGLRSGRLPERIAHNDTKLNNVLMDETSGRGLCVIDLDTVMPGSALYDFGDLVRSAAAAAAEDDPAHMRFDLERFAALARGYLRGAPGLAPAEKALLAFAPRLITYEQGVRFLTDDLNGDVYYPVHAPRHNLRRAQAQFALLEGMERESAAMEEIVQRL